MGIMANPFYVDLGFTKTQIADIAKVFGFFMTIAGAFAGGVLAGGCTVGAGLSGMSTASLAALLHDHGAAVVVPRKGK